TRQCHLPLPARSKTLEVRHLSVSFRRPKIATGPIPDLPRSARSMRNDLLEFGVGLFFVAAPSAASGCASRAVLALSLFAARAVTPLAATQCRTLVAVFSTYIQLEY